MIPHPTARQIDDALAIVHSPDLVHDQPALRTNAWETLLAARGLSANTVRLSAMQHALRQTQILGAHLLQPRGVA